VNTEKQLHGPFIVPASDIRLAGFSCKICRSPVRVARQSVPHLVPRICAFACECGPGIIVCEDERQPSKRNWSSAMELARKKGVDLIIYNGNKPTPPGFAGLN
jgi:hypothetical protein